MCRWVFLAVVSLPLPATAQYLGVCYDLTRESACITPGSSDFDADAEWTWRSLTSPVSDLDGNLYPQAPLLGPPVDAGGPRLGAGALSTPDVWSRVPAAPVSATQPSDVEPFIVEAIEAGPVVDQVFSAHAARVDHAIARGAEEAGAAAGRQVGAHGLAHAVDPEPLDFEQTRTSRTLPSLLRPGLDLPDEAVSDPVLVGTGEMVVDHVDVHVPGVGLDLVIRRRYRSSSSYVGALGFGWTHSFEQYLVRTAGSCSASGRSVADIIDWHTGLGAAIRFHPRGDGRWRPVPHAEYTLVRHSATEWHVRGPDGTASVFGAPSLVDPVAPSQSVGLLRSVHDRNGNTLRVTSRLRAGARPTTSPVIVDRVEDTVGRVFVFDHDPRGFLTAIREPSTGARAAYTVDQRHDLVMATDADGTSESYEYDHDPTRSVQPLRFPSAALERSCRIACGDFNSCGACESVRAASLAECESRCSDPAVCVQGWRGTPSCAASCADACAPGAEVAAQCSSLCLTGEYALAGSVCDVLEPGSPLMCRPGVPGCVGDLRLDATGAPAAACCPLARPSQRDVHQACLRSPPVIEATGALAPGGIEAACASVPAAVASECAASCPGPTACSSACAEEMSCIRYRSVPGETYSIPVPTPWGTFTAFIPTSLQIYDEQRSMRRVRFDPTTMPITEENCELLFSTPVDGSRPFFFVNHQERRGCYDPARDDGEYECNYGSCLTSCGECNVYCAHAARALCEERGRATRTETCVPACIDGSAASCRADCEPRCAASCADRPACVAECAGADLLTSCVDGCSEACAEQQRERDASGAPLERYGNAIDLDHNLLRVRDGEGRLYLENRYEQDVRDPAFDRVTWQRFGGEEVAFRSYALGDPSVVVDARDLGRVDLEPEPVELCASTCQEDLGHLGDRERWISMGAGSFLVFPGTEPDAPSFPVEPHDPEEGWSGLSAFGWYEIERTSAFAGTIRPATIIPAAGLRVRTPRGDITLRSASELGFIQITADAPEALEFGFRANRLTLVHGDVGWRALAGLAAGAATTWPPHACTSEVGFERIGSTVEARAGTCRGTVLVEELGRRDAGRWSSVVSTARGSSEWLFEEGSAPGRAIGRRRGWSPGDEPWEDRTTGCEPAQILDVPDPACVEALRAWPAHTPRPDCRAPPVARGAGGGARPPGGGPSMGCWPESSPALIEGELPSSCPSLTQYRPARAASRFVQPFARATVVESPDGTTRTYYTSPEGHVLRWVNNEAAAVVDFNFDGEGRVMGARDAHGTRTCIQYDDESRPMRRVRLPAEGLPSEHAGIEAWTSFGAFGLASAVWDAHAQPPREVVRIERDARGNPRLVHRDRAGGTLTDEIVSDGRGRPTDVYRADGSARHVGYDPLSGMPALIEDYERGAGQVYWPGVSVLARTTLAHDVWGRPARVNREGGSIEEWDRSPLGRVEETRTWLDPARPMTRETRAHDASGMLTEALDDRTRRSFRWTLQGRLESLVETSVGAPVITRASCVRRVAGELDAFIDADGRWTRRRWSPSAPRVVELERGIAALTGEWAADCAANRTDGAPESMETFRRTTVDASGRPVAISEGPSAVGPEHDEVASTIDYDGHGRPVRRVSAHGVAERWGYTTRDQVAWHAVFHPAIGTQSASVDAMSDLPPSTTLASLSPTLAAYAAFQYDDDGRLTSRRRLWFERAGGVAVAAGAGPGGAWVTESWSFLDAARQVRFTAGDGQVTVTTFDALGRVDRVHGGDGTVLLEDHDYADFGQTLTVAAMDGTAPGGRRVTRQRRTPFGALRAVENEAGQVLWQATYDLYGQRLTESDRAGGLAHTYDALGRHVSTSRVSTAGVVAPYAHLGYTAAGRIQTFKDAALRASTWRYDAAGRVRELEHPDLSRESWTYHAGTERARRHTGRGAEITDAAYDGFGALRAAVSTRGTWTTESTWRRSATGIVATRSRVVDSAGAAGSDVSRTFDRDSLGFVYGETDSLWPQNLRYDRDPLGRWTQLDIVGAHRLRRSFDALGRLDTVGIGDARIVADYGYASGLGPADQVAYANGAVERRSYDDRGRMTASVTSVGSAQPFEQRWVWGTNDVLARWDSVTPSVGRRSFVFATDTVGRLSSAGVRTQLPPPPTSPVSAADVDGWLVGATDREQYVVDAADRWVESRVGSTVTTPSYGPDGRLSAWGTTSVMNDASGRPTRVGGLELVHDGAGRLVASWPVQQPAARTTYHYDADGVLVGWDGPLGDTSRFQYADGRIVRDRQGATTRLLVPSEGLAPVAIVSGGSEYINLVGPGDRLVAALDPSGALTERYELLGHRSPQIASATGAARSTSAIGNRMLLGGQPWAAALASHRQGVRWYRPEWGRFLTPDPLGWADGPNVYAYAGMSPLRWTDPTGLARSDTGILSFLGWTADIAFGAAQGAVGTPPSAWFGHERSNAYAAGFTAQLAVYADLFLLFGGGAASAGGGYAMATGVGAAPGGLALAGGAVAAGLGGAMLGPHSDAVGAAQDKLSTAVDAPGGGAPAKVSEAERTTPRDILEAEAKAVDGAAAAKGAAPAEMRPYGGPGGGHHVPAKRAFEGAPSYDMNQALAVPNAEMARLGVYHPDVTAGQMAGYRAFAKTGGSLTWGDVARIESQALVRGGMKPDVASATVRQGIEALQKAGVPGPTRIPWGGR